MVIYRYRFFYDTSSSRRVLRRTHRVLLWRISNDSIHTFIGYSVKIECNCDELKEEGVESKIRILTPEEINARCTIGANKLPINSIL